MRGPRSRTSRTERCLLVGAWGVLALTLTGCASDYVARTAGARRAYEAGRYDEALKELEPENKVPAQDKLIALLDRGMILHAAGKYEESIAVLAKADQLSQELDFTSVSETAKTLATGEREKTYAGEDFEKLMISTLQGLNYALLGKDEDALVEVRRVNERMLKMIREEKKPYEQLAIARYLSAVLYEDQGDLDDAYLDYAAALKLAPDERALAEPVLRLAALTSRSDDVAGLAQKFPGLDTSKIQGGEGQLVVILETGLSPQKVSSDRNDGAQIIKVPVYVNRRSFTSHAVVTAGNLPPQTTETVTSLERVAQVHLNDRIGRMIAKQVAGSAVKAGLAAGVGALSKSEALGALTFVALSLTNQTDLRSWLSLPAEFEVTRFRLPVGDQQVTLATPAGTTQQTVAIRSRRITLLVQRRY